MSRAQRLVFTLLCVLSCAWAVAALWGQSVRLAHHNMLSAVHSAEGTITHEALTAAIDDYERALRILPCNAALHKDLGLLLAIEADAALDTPNTLDTDAPLKRMHDLMASQLSCTPHDGKAWLDFSTITMYREGFSDHALEAYKLSAQVAPGESWLAQKRLLFALESRPLLDAEAMAVARNDFAVLKRAHPNRMTAVLKASATESEEALAALFVAPVH